MDLAGKVLKSKSVGTGPLSYEKRIYRAVISQRLRNTDLHRCVNLKFRIFRVHYENLHKNSPYRV